MWNNNQQNHGMGQPNEAADYPQNSSYPQQGGVIPPSHHMNYDQNVYGNGGVHGNNVGYPYNYFDPSQLQHSQQQVPSSSLYQGYHPQQNYQSIYAQQQYQQQQQQHQQQQFPSNQGVQSGFQNANPQHQYAQQPLQSQQQQNPSIPLQEPLPLPQQPAGEILVSHQKNTYRFDAKDLATVGDLKNKCSQQTGIDVNKITLLFGGTMLKDPTKRLGDAGVRPGSKVLMMATAPSASLPVQPPQPTPPAQSSNQQVNPEQRIQKIISDINTNYLEEVNSFCQNPPKEADQRKKTHSRLSEMLLQSLLKFDGIEVAENTELREKRRQGVKYTQSLLDRLDAAQKNSSL